MIIKVKNKLNDFINRNMKNNSIPFWMDIDVVMPPVDKVVIFWTGQRVFEGFVDSDGEIWEGEDEEYHSNIKDEYITHWKERNIL